LLTIVPVCGTTLPKDRAVRYNNLDRARLGAVSERGRHVDIKKIAVLGGIGLVLFFLITQPSQAAGLVTNTLNTIKEGATALITFVKALF
jgi:hypothetical protein